VISIVVAIRQADPQVVAARLGPARSRDAGRTIFEHDQIARVRLEGDGIGSPADCAA
jgi:hypothetical protein